jgi:hypothetical protein
MRANQDLRSAPADAWWLGMRQEAAIVFCLRITRAAFIEWDTSQGMMTVHRWSLEDGYHHGSRSYP